MITCEPDALGRVSHALVIVDAGAAPVDLDATRLALAREDGAVVLVCPWPQERPGDRASPQALHAVQRESRQLSKLLGAWKGRTTPIELALDLAPAAALDLGWRLAGLPCRIWLPGEGGWREVHSVEPTTSPDVEDVITPDDVGEAFALGRALARVPRDRLRACGVRGAEVLPLLSIVGAPVYGRAADGTASLLDTARAIEARRGGQDALDLLLPLRDTPADSASAAMLRATLCVRLGASPTPDVDRALALAPQDAAVFERAAWLLVKAGSLDRAEVLADAAIARGRASALVPKVEACLAAGAIERAIEALEEADARQAAKPEVLEALQDRMALAWSQAGQPERAAAAAERRWLAAPQRLATLGTLVRAWIELGRSAEAIALLREVASTSPEAATTLLPSLLRLLVARLDDEQAIEVALSLDAGRVATAEVWRAMATAGARLGLAEAAQWDAAALAAAPASWVDAFAHRVRAGDLAGAEQLLVGRQGAEAYARRAHLALWRLDIDAARSEARAALAADPDCPIARLVEVAADVLDARSGSQLPRLDALLAEGATTGLDETEVRLWKAEHLLALGDTARAAVEIARARSAANGFSVAAMLDDWLCSVAALEPGKVESGLRPRVWAPYAGWLHPLVPDVAALQGGRRVDVDEQVRAARSRLGGNRSTTPTLVRDGALEPWPFPPDARQRASLRQMLVLTREVDEVVMRLLRAASEQPHDPFVRTYGGEVLLWLGRPELAEPLFREALALDSGTVWAWIGLGASELYQGRFGAAQATWSTGVARVGFEGPTIFPYRAEAHWRVGALDRARVDVRIALADKPYRLSARVLDALLTAAEGDESPAQRLDGEVRAAAPTFWTDLDRAAGADASAVARLEAALTLMRGNRSSTMPGYVACGRWWRAIPWPTGASGSG